MDTFKQECKLCDNIIYDGNFKVIEDVTKDIFDVLLLKLKLDNEIQNVMCTTCSSKLLAAFKFKSTCINTDNRIIPYIDFENPKPVDLKEIYVKENGNKQERNVLDGREICRLCLQSMVNVHKPMWEIPVDSIQIYIPEINLALSPNPAICLKCYDALCAHSCFIRDCLDIEKKRNINATIVEDTLLSDPCIKTEEIEIKSEETYDETLSETLEMETKMEGDASPHYQRDLTDTNESKSLCDAEDPKQTGAKSAVENYKSKVGETISESLVADHELRGKRVSQAQVNKSDCSGSSSKRQNSRKNQAKLMRKDLKLRMYQCDKCEFNTRHRGRHHLLHKDPSEVQRYECNECDYKSIYKGNLKKHQLRHKDPSEVRMYECDECEFKSLQKGNLKLHRLKHKDPSELQMYECSECDYKSIHKKHLKRHQLRHKDPSEVQMYECNECDYKSIRKSNLKQHQLKYKDPSEVQMYECNECDFKSTHKGNLKLHQLKHKDSSELQMYECSECDYKSIQKKLLKRHQLRHKDPSEVYMYECGECDYKSIYKSSLKLHQFKHKNPSEVQTYRCDKCEFITKHQPSFSRHLLTHKGPNYESIQKAILRWHQFKYKVPSEEP